MSNKFINHVPTGLSMPRWFTRQESHHRPVGYYFIGNELTDNYFFGPYGIEAEAVEARQKYFDNYPHWDMCDE